MFTACATLDDDKQLLVFGLSFENLDRLKQGQPIFIERKTHGLTIPENLKIVIFSGESEQVMARQMAPLIDKTTVVDQKKGF